VDREPVLRMRWQRSGGQSMTEFALVAPLLFLILLVTIDFGRLVYTYGVITSSARDSARALSLKINQASDCSAYQLAEATAQGFQLAPDQSSMVGDSNPNSPGGSLQPSTPPPGEGYIYIWPAVATATPQDQHPGCDGQARLPASAQLKDVAVQIEYTYQPLIPVFQEFTGALTIKAISVVHTEY
jgi:Flp pilus assembly protein TadG